MKIKGEGMLKVLIKGAVIGLIVVGFTGCVSTSDINVVQSQSEKANLKGYKTYAALSPKGIILDSKGTWIPNNINAHAEIQHMIKTEMDKKGKQLVISNPDFYVAYALGVDMDAIKEKVDKKDQVKIENIPSAGLAIVFTDAKTNEVIWMSVAEGELKKGLSMDDRKKRVQYAIQKMLNGL
jgi:outer membrane lipoprotein-sorting protein